LKSARDAAVGVVCLHQLVFGLAHLAGGGGFRFSVSVNAGSGIVSVQANPEDGEVAVQVLQNMYVGGGRVVYTGMRRRRRRKLRKRG
jgi:hypothetical protein